MFTSSIKAGVLFLTSFYEQAAYFKVVWTGQWIVGMGWQIVEALYIKSSWERSDDLLRCRVNELHYVLDTYYVVSMI